MTQTAPKAMDTSGVLITVLALQYVVVFGSGAYDLMDCVISMITGGFAYTYRGAGNTSILNKSLLSLILGSAIATLLIVSIISIGFEIENSLTEFCTFVRAEKLHGFFEAKPVCAGLDFIELSSLAIAAGMLVVPIAQTMWRGIRS